MTILENVKVSDMEREEAIALLERYSNYDGMGIQNLAGCKEAMKVAVELLKEAYPELKESEDEKIRKGLLEALKTSKTVGELKFILPEPTREECVAYLEKQKNLDKMIVVSPEVWDGAINDAYENGKKDGEKQKGQNLIMANSPQLKEQKPWKVGANAYFTPEQKPADLSEMMVHKEPYIAPVPTPMVADEQKPAEWSEEDEEISKRIIADLRWGRRNTVSDKDIRQYDEEINWMENRLKSLRPVSKEFLQPHWKPSEGQMKVLAMFSNLRCVSRQEAATLESLYNDLKKRM